MKPLCILALFALSLSACAGSNQNKGQLPPSSSSPAYATTHPGAMSATEARLDAELATARKNITEMQQWPAALSNPDWTVVEGYYQDSDQAGRSQAVAERLGENMKIAEFSATISPEASKKAASAAAATLASKEGTEIETNLKPTIKRAFDDSAEQGLNDRLAEVHDAYQRLEMDKETLGKDNTKTLQEQILLLTWTVWWVHVESNNLANRLSSQISESDDVRKTLENAIAERQKRIDDPNTPKGSKKVAEDQLAAMQGARDSLELSTESAKLRIEALKKDLPALKEEYKKAFEALMKDVKARRQEQAK